MWRFGRGRPMVAPGVVIAMALLLTVSPLATGWTQSRGSDNRAGTTSSLPPVLDVLSAHTVPGAESTTGFETGPVWVETSRGLATIYQNAADRCVLLSVTNLEPWTAEESELESCARGHVVAYDPKVDVLFVCAEGSPSDKVLFAL